MASSNQDHEKDEDPIVATYSVFLKPPLPQNRKLVVLQHVTKTAADPSSLRPPRIAEVRIKPHTGMFEVDMPIDTDDAYDKHKGIEWGVALKNAMETKKGGSLGLAGGFGVGAPVARPAGGRRAADRDEDESRNLTWAEATRQDKVLRVRTLGGGRSAEEDNTKHMVGVFQGRNIHLTPVSTVVSLRPVPHHMDAMAERDKNSTRQLPGAEAGPGAGGKGGPGAGAGRAIQMMLKSATNGDGVATETMADRLRAVQVEPWRRMEWVPDNDLGAWAAYNESLFFRTTAARAKPAVADEEDKKGKGPETEASAADTAGGDDAGSPDLVEKVDQLKTDWQEEELLRALAGMKHGDLKPGEEALVTRSTSATQKKP